MRCLIISGGEFSKTPEEKFDLIIACDKGYSYAKKLSIKPDVVIGDFDSLEIDVEKDIEVIKLPKKKDDTDTYYAAKYAIDHGATEICICSALGGRLDHTIANIQTISYIASKNIKAMIYDNDKKVYAIHDSSISIKKESYDNLSIFAMDDICEGVSITGTEYELRDENIKNNFPIGVSNTWTCDFADISVKKGTLIIICS